MKIGIIGAGHIGSTLVRKLRKLNHEVRVANSRGPETLAGLSKETGARAVNVRDAVKDVDLVVITIPEKNIEQLPSDLFRDVPETVVVVDTGNYYPALRDGTMADLEKAPSESSWVAQKIGRPVIKVFNSIIAHSLANGGEPRGTRGRLALPVSGDDLKAKTMVMKLVDDLGFDPVDAGSLDESWRQQPGTPVYCTNLDKPALLKALSETNRDRSEKIRKIAEEKLKELPPESPPDAMVKLVRSLQRAA
jgi:8-hydroxy-5-deazaflavin:NADPH oxidoreductase